MLQKGKYSFRWTMCRLMHPTKKKFCIPSTPKKKFRTTFCAKIPLLQQCVPPTYPAKSTFLFNHTYKKMIGVFGKVLIHYMEAGAPKKNQVLLLNHSKQECLWCILPKNMTDFSAYLPSQIYMSLRPHIQKNDRRVRQGPNTLLLVDRNHHHPNPPLFWM